MLPGVTAALAGRLWVAAGLTLYTGYAYLQSGPCACADRTAQTKCVAGARAAAAKSGEIVKLFISPGCGRRSAFQKRRSEMPPSVTNVATLMISFVSTRRRL